MLSNLWEVTVSKVDRYTLVHNLTSLCKPFGSLFAHIVGACNANGKTPVGVIGLKKKIMTHKKLKSPKYRGSRAPSPVVKLKSSTLSTDEDFETTLSRGDDSDEKAKVNAKSESDREDKLTPRGDGVER